MTIGALQKGGQQAQIVGIVSKDNVKKQIKVQTEKKPMTGAVLPSLPVDHRPQDQGLWSKEIRVKQLL